MKKIICALLAVALVAVLFVGCGGGYKDGTYTGQSSKDDRGAYGEITVTVKGGKITDAQYVTYQADGSIKDENYGKKDGQITNQENYDKAQVAVKAMPKMAAQLVEKQNVRDVDAVAGATSTYNQFVEAANNALAQAKK